MNCVGCASMTNNPKFCSRSCAAKTNNRLTPKRKALVRECRTCGGVWQLPRVIHQSNRCPACAGEFKHSSATIGHVRAYQSSVGKHRSWLHATVRQRARAKFKQQAALGCEICKYAKHVEICHIKGVTTFPDTALIDEEVNAPTNVRFLCPNHHWEFDHGLLD